MKASQAVIVQSVDGALISSKVAIENLLEAAAIRGAKPIAIKKQIGSIQLREEILGMPIFDKLAGPMYGGDGVVRYEDADAYKVLSA